MLIYNHKQEQEKHYLYYVGLWQLLNIFKKMVKNLFLRLYISVEHMISWKLLLKNSEKLRTQKLFLL